MVTFLATSKEGGLDFGSDYNQQRFRIYLKEHPNKTFQIKEVVRKRTSSQNNFYWLYLQLIERETGNDANDLHEIFRRKFLAPKFIKGLDGTEVRIPRSTQELTRTEFSDYMDKICAESEIPIPDSEKYKEWRDSSPLMGEEYND